MVCRFQGFKIFLCIGRAQGMQEVHLWMWKCFGSLWSEEAEEIAPPRESNIDQEIFHFLGLLDKAHSTT